MSCLILPGDCIEQLRTWMLDGEAQTCVTSPPYFGLRDYGVHGQIGLEPTIEQYVAKMVEVFREVRRVLRDDGTLWLNLGDSYAGSGRGGDTGKSGLVGTTTSQDESKKGRAAQRGSQLAAGLHESTRRAGNIGRAWVPPPPGVKMKELIGIPWRVAFALQADGWYLRQDIIWHKPNPMPESIRDRCTKAHEYLFLFAKSRRYYFDSEAMQEPAVSTKPSGNGFVGRQGGSRDLPMSGGEGTEERWQPGATRNRRSVWTVTTKPFKGAHFATFPPDLIEPCILAGSRPGDMVLDPFGGAGTTALVANKHGRNAVLCELNPEYVALMNSRLRGAAA